MRTVRAATALAAVLIAGGAVPALASPASADPTPCPAGQLCYWHSPGFPDGSKVGFSGDDPNYSDNQFTTEGVGQGDVVSNNEQDFVNNDPARIAVVFTDPNFTGDIRNFFPLTGEEILPPFIFNIESHFWIN